MTDTRIQHVVDAISDGERIDWESVRRRFSDRTTANYYTHLETVSKIAGLSPVVDGPQEGARDPVWVSVLVAVATAQISLGLVGSIAYRPHTFVNALRLLTVLAFAGVGIVLRQKRNSMRARDLGTAFLLRAFGFSRPPYTLLFDAWFPAAAGIAFFRSGLAVDAWMPFFIWRFARRFPATTRFTLIDRTAIAFTTTAGMVGTALFAINLWVSAVHPRPGLVWEFATTHEEAQRYFATTLALMLPALPLILIRARSAPADERARVRLFALAMVAGGAPICIELILEALFPRYTAFLRASDGFRSAMAVSVIIPLLTIPFVTGYSILVHRLLDVRFVIRQGIRYLFAKWTLAALTLAPFGLLASHVYVRRNDSVVNVMSDRRGVILMALVGIGCVLLAGRSILVRIIDRWFDRRAADRTAVLARSGDAMRLVRTHSELAASVAAAAEGALNASASVHFFNPQRQAYVSVDRGGLSLPGESALAIILTQEPTLAMLRTNREDSIARFLPHTDRLWLGEAGVYVVAPIRSTGINRPAGLIAFGPRRDAIGYTHDDEQFVTALASAAGIAFENLRLRSGAVGEESADDFGMLCTRCRRVTDGVEDERSCPCGGKLEAAAVPRRINGKFLVEALLGAGGMGVAYLALDIALDRHVAIKTLPSVSADAMARLGREARTMAALSHPNLATILGHESWRGTPILVCEYLHGGTLQQRLARGPLAVDEALTLGIRLLEALEYMHGHGVLHRDIKPSNIAFTSDKTPKLLDFGLAGLMELAQPPAIGDGPGTAPLLGTTIAGTVAYLPPQAFRGEAPTPRFDLWGLAVVLCESIVGRHPFAAGIDTGENICRGRFAVPIDSQREIPAAVGAFLRRALNPDLNRQFDSSTAMREAMMALRVAHHS